MDKDFLKKQIEQQYKLQGNSLYNINADYITKQINDGSEFIQPISISNIERGKFYFIMYDLAGKSTKMEQFNPLFVIDWFDIDNSRYLFAVSLNFIPVNIRTVFFNNILNYNLSILTDNENLKLNKQSALSDINFSNIYNMLQSIGFEWSIRKFDFKLINQIYNVDMNIISKFITMSTAKITSVDDNKLIEIWVKKIKQQEARHKDMIAQLTLDYKNIDKQLSNTFQNLDKQADNLQKSLQVIKNNFK